MVPSPLLLELLSCSLCARSLETLELELGDFEGGRGGESDGLHDFPQVGMNGGIIEKININVIYPVLLQNNIYYKCIR